MTRHPHFDDRGTLPWHTRLADARTAAERDGKLILVEMGREPCSNCRTFVQAVVPAPGVADTLKAHFVGLASDVDDPEQELVQLAMDNLPGAMMLPFVMVLDADGTFLAGSHGAVHPKRFQESVAEVLAERGAG